MLFYHRLESLSHNAVLVLKTTSFELYAENLILKGFSGHFGKVLQGLEHDSMALLRGARLLRVEKRAQLMHNCVGKLATSGCSTLLVY